MSNEAQRDNGDDMEILNFMHTTIDTDTFFKLINRTRKSNKNGWYTFVGRVDGKTVSVKGYNTWLQIYRVDGIDHSSPMDITVKHFNHILTTPFRKE